MLTDNQLHNIIRQYRIRKAASIVAHNLQLCKQQRQLFSKIAADPAPATAGSASGAGTTTNPPAGDTTAQKPFNVHRALGWGILATLILKLFGMGWLGSTLFGLGAGYLGGRNILWGANDIGDQISRLTKAVPPGTTQNLQQTYNQQKGRNPKNVADSAVSQVKEPKVPLPDNHRPQSPDSGKVMKDLLDNPGSPASPSKVTNGTPVHTYDGEATDQTAATSSATTNGYPQTPARTANGSGF